MHALDLMIQMRKCYDGKDSVEAFEDWFDMASWNVHQQKSDVLTNAVFAIEAILADYASGCIDESVLKNCLFLLGMSIESAVRSFSASFVRASASSKPLEFNLSLGTNSEMEEWRVFPKSALAAQMLELACA